MKADIVASVSHAGRRPLKVREIPGWKPLARALLSRGATPNIISMIGLGSALLSGLLLAWTGHVASGHVPLLVASLVLMVLRAFCNIMDGVMAVEGGAATPSGALYNEVPDRIADAAILIGAGYAAGSHPVLGWAAALVAVGTAYVRVQCQVAGTRADYGGWFGKPGRMVLLAAGISFLILAPPRFHFMWAPVGEIRLGAIGLAVLLIVIGGLITSAGRLRRAGRELSISARAEPDVKAMDSAPPNPNLQAP